MKQSSRNWLSISSCLIIPVYFIIHNLIDFGGLVRINKIIVDALLWILLPLILLSIYNWLYKNLSKAALLTSVILFIYFFGATLLNEIKSISFFSKFLRYTISLPLLLLSLFLFHLYLRKTNTSFIKANLFIAVTFCVLFLFDLYRVLADVDSWGKKNNLLFNNKGAVLLPKNNTVPKPDIFFLIFDEYPSSKSLSNVFQYNNNSHDSNLLKAGFQVSSYAKSAYFNTPACIYSVLGLTELPPIEEKGFSFKEQLTIIQQLSTINLIPFLEENGYRFINSSMFHFKNHPSTVRDYIYWNPPEDLIKKQLFFNRIQADIGWNFTRFYKKSFMQNFNENIFAEVKYSEGIERSLDSSLMFPENQPKFFYGHFFLPHDPYKFDENGNTITWNYESYIKNYDKSSSYLTQVKYANKLMIKLYNKILSTNKRPAIIIFQGDHGNRKFVEGKFPSDEKTKIFSAIYFPDQNYTQITDSLYAPNTFRIILNKYFNQDLPLLIRKSEKIPPTHSPSTPSQ